jgi:hypothetical protein
MATKHLPEGIEDITLQVTHLLLDLFRRRADIPIRSQNHRILARKGLASRRDLDELRGGGGLSPKVILAASVGCQHEDRCGT